MAAHNWPLGDYLLARQIGNGEFGIVYEASHPVYGSCALKLILLTGPDSDEKVGRIEDKTSGGKIRTIIEVDLAIPRLLTWAVGALMVDLARLRRAGWPEVPSSGPEEQVESIEEALGPRRRR